AREDRDRGPRPDLDHAALTDVDSRLESRRVRTLDSHNHPADNPTRTTAQSWEDLEREFTNQESCPLSCDASTTAETSDGGRVTRGERRGTSDKSIAEMRITQVETIVVNMPMVIEGPVLPQQGGRARTSMDTLLVRVETDGGVTGWGEGFGHRIFPATKAALDTLIGPMCVGRDPTAIAALMGELQRNLTGVGRNGPAMYALSAIDIALWDIAGKLAGLPLYRLLGGSARKTLPAYASLLRYGEPGAVAHYVER